MEYIGIDQDGPWIHTAQIKKSRNSIQILNIQTCKKQPDEKRKNVNRLYINGSSQGLFKHRTVITGLSPQEALIRPINLKVSKKTTLKKALRFHAESLTSLQPEETILQSHIAKPKNNSTDAIIFTTTQHALKDHLASFQEIDNIDPDIVTSCSMALVRFTQLLSSDSPSAYIVHLGMTQTTCVLMKNGLPYASHVVGWGLHDFHQALLADFPQEKAEDISETIDLLETEEKRPRLYKFSQKFGVEISKVLHSFAKSLPKEKHPLMLTGFCSSFRKMDLYFHTHLEELISASIENTPKEKTFPEIRKYALSIGMILDVVTQDKKALQFRQHPFAPKSQIRNFAKKVLALTFAAIFISAGILAFSRSLLNKQESQLHDQLHVAQVIDAMKMNREKPKRNYSLTVEEKLNQWQSEILREANSFPFILNVPNVSEFLSWISKLEVGSIQIQDIQYELVGAPNLENLKEPYLTKVQIEFQAPSSTDARKFHDKVLSGEGLVDSEKEISWDVLSNCYKASFYLKTRGAHE